jgi:hypothetical protein
MVEKRSFRKDLNKSVDHDNRLISCVETYLSQKVLVGNISSMKELKDKLNEKKPLNIMMGQTFDEGQPLDLLKYAFVIMNTSDMINKLGIETHSKWLIADHFITDINQDQSLEKVKEQAEKRVIYLQQINNIFNGKIDVVYSSDLSRQENYKNNLSILSAETDKNRVFKKKVLEAVPEDRRANLNAYRYPLEELATIQSMNTDIKVGPPYEKYYDEPARDVASMIGFKRYIAMHLTNSVPFGDPEISPDVKKEIGEFGVLPYKINSKELRDYRIDPINDTLVKTTNLVESTNNIRALLDLLIVAGQAKQRLNGNPNFSFREDLLKPYGLEKIFKNRHDLIPRSEYVDLQNLALDLYLRYIHRPLNGTRRLNQDEY